MQHTYPAALYIALGLTLSIGSSCGTDNEGRSALTGSSTVDAQGGAADSIASVPNDVVTSENDTIGSSDTSSTPGEPPNDTGSAEDAGASADLPQPPPVGPGKILVDPTTYQFSYVAPQEALLTKQIAIFNSGSGPLVITGVSMQPGGSPEFGLIGVPPPNTVLNPGKSTLAIARFLDDPQQAGDGTIVITSDDPENPTVEVELTSFLKASLPVPCAQLSPSSLNFGNVIRGETKTMTAELKNCSDDKPLSLEDIKRSSNFFGSLTEEFQVSPEPTAPIEIPAGGSLPIEVSYTPLLAGSDFGHFDVFTDDPETPSQQLDVSGVGVAPPLEQLGLSIRLSWDADNTDVDSHLVAPGGTLFDCSTDCFFANPSPDWGTAGDWVDDPFLDLDDVDGFGPENINISEPQAGIFTYTVHYWDDTWDGSSAQASNATVAVFSYGSMIAEFGPVKLDATNRTWDVFTLEWPSMNIVELNTLYETSGSGFCPGSLFP